MNPRILFRLLKETFFEWQQDKASNLAASLAYYTVFSLTPLLLIAISVAGIIFDEAAARGEIVNQIKSLVGTQGAEAIEVAIDNANKPGSSGGIASIISILVLLFGASGVFAQLQEALNTVWNVKAKPGKGVWGFIRKRFLSFSVVLVICFLLLISLVFSAALSAFNQLGSNFLPGFDILWQIFNIAISLGIITLLFALMYKYLPDAKISWKDVWVGAMITALLFTVGKWGLGLYLGRASFASTYGAAGSLVIVLAWVYYSTQILLFGAEFTQVYARRYGSRIVPDEHAVKE